MLQLTTLLAVVLHFTAVHALPTGDAVSVTIVPSTFEPFKAAYCVAFFQDGAALYYGIGHTPVRGAYVGDHDGQQLAHWLTVMTDSGFARLSPAPIPVDAGVVRIALRRSAVVTHLDWNDVTLPDWLQDIVWESMRAAESVHWQSASHTLSDCRLR
jgi:hypothetical protein